MDGLQSATILSNYLFLSHAVIQWTSQHTEQSLNIIRVNGGRNWVLKELPFNPSCNLADEILRFLKKTAQQNCVSKYRVPSEVKTM